MKVKTIGSEKVWQSPDGKKVIYEVRLQDEKGDSYVLKTYSDQIKEVGFEGEVESYTSDRGDKFARQPKAEGGYGGGGNNATRAKQDAEKQGDIKAEWAIGQAIKATGQFPLDADALVKVEELATKLFQMVDRVKAPEVPKA